MVEGGSDKRWPELGRVRREEDFGVLFCVCVSQLQTENEWLTMEQDLLSWKMEWQEEEIAGGWWQEEEPPASSIKKTHSSVCFGVRNGWNI
ncbi:hypothetical protein R6Q59_018783 [Mikania micrantha]